MFSASRKDDAVFEVCQDNQAQKVEIIGMNPAAESLVGYTSDRLIGESLNVILPSNLQEVVNSYVEYEKGGDDLAVVLKRTRKFHIVNHAGVKVPVQVKSFYTATPDANPRFELLMRDMTLIELMDSMKEELLQDKAEHEVVDPETGLPRYESLMQYLSVVQSLVQRHGVPATFGIIRLDNIEIVRESHGIAMLMELIKEVGERFKQNSREEDTIGLMQGNQLGFILFNCNAENAKMVLNRIRMSINAEPILASSGQSISTTVSISFAELFKDTAVENVTGICNTALEQATDDGGNRIYKA